MYAASQSIVFSICAICAVIIMAVCSDGLQVVCCEHCLGMLYVNCQTNLSQHTDPLQLPR